VSRDSVMRLLVFRASDELFGVDLRYVQEVIDGPNVQRIPDMPASVLGVTTVRDTLVVVHDPHPLLRVGIRRVGAVLIFNDVSGYDRGRRIGLAVDDVRDTMSTERDDIRPAPWQGDGALAGVVRRGRLLIGVLDADVFISGLRMGPEAEAERG
jgi:purine-binding chemotaxis protein CheW